MKLLPTPTDSPCTDDVSAALSLLRDALGEEEQRIRNEGSRAMQSGAYDTATAVIDFAKRLLAFKAKVDGLVVEWEGLEEFNERATPEVQEIVSKRFFGKKAKKGEITPQEAYFRPILDALVELGGKAKTKVVLDRVGEKMKLIFKPLDYAPHSSSQKQIRRRNSAQWARNTMANEDGRMRGDSPSGNWEISDKGRKWLKEEQARG